MESIIKARVLRIRKIESYLKDYDIKLGNNNKETKEIFLDHFLSKNKNRIKVRSRFRRKLMRQ